VLVEQEILKLLEREAADWFESIYPQYKDNPTFLILFAGTAARYAASRAVTLLKAHVIQQALCPSDN
jgi:hypothetical protein